eukprot:COSAG01_NODE_1215_length_11206_cov_8.747096_6_plen_207_part_00
MRVNLWCVSLVLSQAVNVAAQQGSLMDPFNTNSCPWSAFMGRTQQVETACCRTGPCAGFPTACDAQCATVFIPFIDECRDTISHFMAQQEPAMNGLADQCLIGNGMDLIRMVRELQDAQCCIDTSQIVSRSQTFAEVESEREYELIFRHDSTGGFFTSRNATLSSHSQDPLSKLYSRLDQLERFRDRDGLFTFKMVRSLARCPTTW